MYDWWGWLQANRVFRAKSADLDMQVANKLEFCNVTLLICHLQGYCHLVNQGMILSHSTSAFFPILNLKESHGQNALVHICAGLVSHRTASDLMYKHP